MSERLRGNELVKSVFVIGAKSIGQYGGYETFLDKLTDVHQQDESLQYYIVTKSNGEGAMDETKLSNVSVYLNRNEESEFDFEYHKAKVVKISVPQIGPAQAIAYDLKAFDWCLSYISRHRLSNSIIYVLACRIGPFFGSLVNKAHKFGVKVYINPDGHEWKRSKWIGPVRKYWKLSEKLMVKHADLVVCDSLNIKKYVESEYSDFHPKTVYIAYGADVELSTISNDDPLFANWMKENNLMKYGYYMCCGRFVPENSFEIMIKEFMKSKTERDFVIISTKNDAFLNSLENKLHWKKDTRIKFVGTVYNAQLLKKIRENAYCNFHGHTVGGTNPSLLEALSSTDLNLLIDVGFNREVAEDSALYWNPDDGNLAKLIDKVDLMTLEERKKYGDLAKSRIKNNFSWQYIGAEYKKLWLSC